MWLRLLGSKNREIFFVFQGSSLAMNRRNKRYARHEINVSMSKLPFVYIPRLLVSGFLEFALDDQCRENRGRRKYKLKFK